MSTKASNRPGTRASAGRKSDTPEKPDRELSLSEWKKLPNETLRLKCNSNGLELHGNKQDRAVRLFGFYHPDGVARRRQVNAAKNKKDRDDDEPVMPPRPREIIRAEDEEPGEPGEEEEDTFPYEQSARRNGTGRKRKEQTPPPQEEPDREREINLSEIIQKQIDAAMQPVLEEMSVHRQKVDLAQAENRALRSQLQSSKSTDFSISSPALGPSDFSTTSSGAVSQNSTAVHDTRQLVPPAAATSSGAGDNFGPLLPLKKNPFTLPGLLKKDLLLIEQGEYLDFDRIKPKRIDQRKQEEGEDGFGVAMTTYYDHESGEETLRLKKVCSNKIECFPDWVECWIKYMIARLHYHPEEHAVLIAYQRLITSFAKKFKFAAVYNYDIDFRKIMAAERSLPPMHRTALWDKQHDELRNEHLSIDQMKAPKSCFKCKDKGHVATNCPKNNNFSGSKNRSGFGSGASNNGPRHPGPPPPPPPPPPQPFQSFHQFQNPYFPPSYAYQPGNVGPPSNNNHFYGAGSNQQQKKKPCNKFNHEGQCWRGPTCHFSHACNKCGRTDHGGINCDQNTSTGFSPQAPSFIHPSSNYRPRF